MEIRPTRTDELEACFDLYVRANDALERERGNPPMDPGDVGWVRDFLAHLASTDPERSLIAIDDGEPIAFGSASARDDLWFLSFLYVAPERQGAGVGRTVLEALLPPDGKRSSATLATVVETIYPVSTMLYARYGIAPRLPLYWLRGVPRLDALPTLPPGVAARPLTLEDGPGLDAVDRALLGHARPQDHAMWAATSRSATAYVRDDGTLVGYAYLADDGWLGPALADDEPLTAAIVRDLLERRDGDATDVTVTITGHAGRLLPTLLGAGFRSGSGAGAIYGSSGRVPPPSYLPYGGYLP